MINRYAIIVLFITNFMVSSFFPMNLEPAHFHWHEWLAQDCVQMQDYRGASYLKQFLKESRLRYNNIWKTVDSIKEKNPTLQIIIEPETPLSGALRNYLGDEIFLKRPFFDCNELYLDRLEAQLRNIQDKIERNKQFKPPLD